MTLHHDRHAVRPEASPATASALREATDEQLLGELARRGKWFFETARQPHLDEPEHRDDDGWLGGVR